MTETTTPGHGPALTDHDRWLITKARELAQARNADELRAYTGQRDHHAAHAYAFGAALPVLTELAAALERLAGAETDPEARAFE